MDIEGDTPKGNGTACEQEQGEQAEGDSQGVSHGRDYIHKATLTSILSRVPFHLSRERGSPSPAAPRCPLRRA